jgi:hypothetical protein
LKPRVYWQKTVTSDAKLVILFTIGLAGNVQIAELNCDEFAALPAMDGFKHFSDDQRARTRTGE